MVQELSSPLLVQRLHHNHIKPVCVLSTAVQQQAAEAGDLYLFKSGASNGGSYVSTGDHLVSNEPVDVMGGGGGVSSLGNRHRVVSAGVDVLGKWLRTTAALVRMLVPLAYIIHTVVVIKARILGSLLVEVSAI